MGEVYRAHDTQLGRDVALKLLPPEMASQSEARERFRQEARALAALDHPNIVTVHSVEEDGGRHFLTMGLVEGQSLDQLIPPQGLPLPQLLDLAIPLVEALAAAHEKGVVHRDVKPGNVMVTPAGRLKVLDFGLAKSLRHPSAGAHSQGTGTESRGPDSVDDETFVVTTPGTLLGTMPYMSPEQAEGLAVDARSDIFSLGVVLYEMATGRRPFEGASPAALVSAILRDTPEPMTAYRSDLPPALVSCVSRCLEKGRTQRTQSLRDTVGLLTRLRRETETSSSDSGMSGELHLSASSEGTPPSRRPSGQGQSTAAAEQSVAVLPFVNHSADSDDEYFSDGITEEILNALIQIEGLRVAARTSSFAFKGSNQDLRAVGETLRVRHVLEGSVRRAGARLRITAQLVDVETGYHLWSERYDRELTDVFEIQDEIASAIASKLEVTLASSGQRPTRKGTSNLEAFDLYLRGLALQNRRGRAIYEAIECFDRATALDPHYVDALAWAADGHRLLATYGFERSTTAMPRARAAAERALAIDSNHPETLATLADIAGQYERDHAAAFGYWQRALQANPEHTRARCERAAWGLFIVRGESEDAVGEARAAVDADPLNVWAMSMLTLLLGFSGRPEDGLTIAERALALDPKSYLCQYVAVQSKIWSKDWDGAIAGASSVLQGSGRHPWILGALGVAQAGAGDSDVAEAIYAELQARVRMEYVQPFWLAYVAGSLGKLEEAIAWSRKSVEEKDPMALFIARWPGFREVVETHPVFPDLLRALRVE